MSNDTPRQGFLTTEFHAIAGESVVAYYVKGFSGGVEDYRWWYDPHKAEFVLRLYVRRPPATTTLEEG